MYGKDWGSVTQNRRGCIVKKTTRQVELLPRHGCGFLFDQIYLNDLYCVSEGVGGYSLLRAGVSAWEQFQPSGKGNFDSDNVFAERTTSIGMWRSVPL